MFEIRNVREKLDEDTNRRPEYPLAVGSFNFVIFTKKWFNFKYVKNNFQVHTLKSFRIVDLV